MRTAVALGSNLGDRLANLRAARKAIVSLPNVKPPISSSAIYETEPVDCQQAEKKVLNAVIEFEYESSPSILLEDLIQIEEALGRSRDHRKNASRTIDLDLLYCGDGKMEDGRWHLPHPGLHWRSFVPQP